MGVVFVAVAPDVERPVALKVLAPQAAADPRLRERFAREAATLARLDSPHIVYILEYGEQDGCPYLVTQLVPGGDLRRYVEEHGPLSPRQAAAVMEQVAAGLEEAHSQGVVHRDLKSANVLLRVLPGGQLHAYLCDFGIARADNHETTSASGVVGTLEYLAPERQSGAPASFATDIYSLGCLLWAAVTGAPPYRGSEVDVAVAHLRAPVPRLPGDDPVSRRIERDRGPGDGQEARRPLCVRPRDAAGARVAERRWPPSRRPTPPPRSMRQVGGDRPTPLVPRRRGRRDSARDRRGGVAAPGSERRRPEGSRDRRHGTPRPPRPRPPQTSVDAGTAEFRRRPRVAAHRRGHKDCSGSIPASSRTG